MSAASFGGRSACHVNVALFGLSRRGLAAAERGVTAWRRETRLVEGGRLPVGSGLGRRLGAVAGRGSSSRRSRARPVVGTGIG